LEWEEEASGSYYAECVSSNLHSQLLMDQACMKKKLVTLKQESKELHRYLFELNPNDEEEQEKTSNLQT